MNMRFPGQYEDSESGLYQNYFRDYDPGIGRYVESDPIGIGGGVNYYAYSNNSPALFVDYYGLKVTGSWAVSPFITVNDVNFTGFGKSVEDNILFKLFYDVTGSGFAQIACSEDCPDQRNWSLTLILNNKTVPVQVWVTLPKGLPIICPKRLPPRLRLACQAGKWGKRGAGLASLISKGKYLATEEGKTALMAAWNIGMSAPNFPTFMCENFPETNRLEF